MTIFVLIFTALTAVIFLFLSAKIQKMKNGGHMAPIPYSFQNDKTVILPNMSDELKSFIFNLKMWPCGDENNDLASYVGIQRQMKNLEDEITVKGKTVSRNDGELRTTIFFTINNNERLNINARNVIKKDGIWYTQDDL